MRGMLLLILLVQAGQVPKLDDKTCKPWVDFVRPSAEELKWKRIPWRTDFLAAVEEAKALQRPILLWSDQGNPLGLVDMAPSVNTVIARHSVWSDDEVQRLAAQFLPVTAEVWTLATGKGPASEFFHKADGPADGGRAHGLYLMTPDGDALGFHFLSRPKEPVVKLMTDGLKKWGEIAAKRGYKPKPVPPRKEKLTWPEAAARAGLLLQVNARDLPRGAVQHPGKTPEEQAMWNQSFLELSEKEAAALVPQGGSKSVVPEEVLRKIARKHLSDFARGNSAGYRTEGFLKKASMTTETIASKDSRITVRFHGEMMMEEGTPGYDPKAHGTQLSVTGDHRIDVEGLYGYDCTLHGKAVYDTVARRFGFFELVAVGLRKGLRPKDDASPNPLGVSFTLEGQYDKPLSPKN
ncbi:MAG TPA: hypothetical protein VJB14_08940 [Planctomycetota bacterium]|nr:hypothetical protein [Planctomycetota bacterium]